MNSSKDTKTVAAAVLADNPELAARLLTQLVFTSPHDPENHVLLGRALVRLRQFSQAQDCFLEAVTLAPESMEGWLQLASVRRLMGCDEEALEAIIQATHVDKKSIAAWQLMDALCVKLNRPHDLLAARRALVKLEPESPDVWLKLAVQLARMGQLVRARKILRVLEDEASDFVASHPYERHMIEVLLTTSIKSHAEETTASGFLA